MRTPEAVRRHWPEYLMEAAGLGCFMVVACLVAALFEYPGSPVHHGIPNPVWRRILIGVAMGSTAAAIVYSPWGRRSGAHLNPSVTLTFFTLGKVAAWDAFCYVIAQFAGGVAGVVVSAWILGEVLRHRAVNYVVTAPGSRGPVVAFWAELAISGILMTTVLLVSNTKALTRLAGVFAGALVAAYIAIEAPLSGMSMNPARTFGSAFSAHQWTAWWIYFTAPVLGMLLAGRLYVAGRGARKVYCAKLYHGNGKSCIFRCNYGELS
jgi:aquaporin Z